LAFSVHVSRESDISQLGQRLGSTPDKIIQAPPFWHHEDTGQFFPFGLSIVVHQITD
jgi:hypothetical protein